MKQAIKLINVLILSLLITSCGDSPLLNHEDESNTPLSNISELNGPQKNFYIDGKKINLRMSWTIGPFPSPAKESKVLITILDANGDLVNLPSGYHLELWGFMPSMGHGTAYDGYIEHIGLGTYMNYELFFNMPGDWDVNIDLYNGSNKITSIKYSIYL